MTPKAMARIKATADIKKAREDDKNCIGRIVGRGISNRICVLFC